MNTSRTLPPEAPARGSFPLDHAGECKAAASAYLSCIKDRSHAHAHSQCRDLSKAYLQCRMHRGLMAEEDLDTLGFGAHISVKPGSDEPAAQGEIIAGLAAAKRKKGTVFGIGS